MGMSRERCKDRFLSKSVRLSRVGDEYASFFKVILIVSIRCYSPDIEPFWFCFALNPDSSIRMNHRYSPWLQREKKVSLTSNLTLELDTFCLTVTLLTFDFEKNANLNFANSWFFERWLTWTSSTLVFQKNYLTLTFHFSILLDSNFFEKAMHSWTLKEFWWEEPPPPPYLPGGHLGQTWKVTPWGEFLSSEDCKKLIIHPMYIFDNVDALWSDVWGPDHLLQPSVQAHLILMIFSGRGSCIYQIWKVSPWGEFLSSEDNKKLMIHPMYLFDNVYRLLQPLFWG